MGQPFGAMLKFRAVDGMSFFLKEWLLKWVQNTDGFEVKYMILGGLMKL